MTSTARRVSAILLAAYLLFLGVVLMEYNPTIAIDVIARTGAWLEARGAPALATGPGRVELLLNTAMFVPVTFLAALTFPRHPWANWVVYALVASIGVELVQGFYLPPRSAQFEDVVANTTGALIGAVAAALVIAVVARTRQPVDVARLP